MANKRKNFLLFLGKRYTNDEGLVTGWGKTAENRPVSTVLREVSVPILSNAKCGAFYGHSQITDNMLCAGFKDGGKDSCQVTSQKCQQNNAFY
jgi:Trypsin